MTLAYSRNAGPAQSNGGGEGAAYQPAVAAQEGLKGRALARRHAGASADHAVRAPVDARQVGVGPVEFELDLPGRPGGAADKIALGEFKPGGKRYADLVVGLRRSEERRVGKEC